MARAPCSGEVRGGCAANGDRGRSRRGSRRPSRTSSAPTTECVRSTTTAATTKRLLSQRATRRKPSMSSTPGSGTRSLARAASLDRRCRRRAEWLRSARACHPRVAPARRSVSCWSACSVGSRSTDEHTDETHRVGRRAVLRAAGARRRRAPQAAIDTRSIGHLRSRPRSPRRRPPGRFPAETTTDAVKSFAPDGVPSSPALLSDSIIDRIRNARLPDRGRRREHHRLQCPRPASPG